MTRAAPLAIVLASIPLALSARQASPPPSLPPAPGLHVVTVSDRGTRGNEPGIAVDPNNPNHVVVTWQGHAHVAYSNDGGRTFTEADGTDPPDFGWRSVGDVSITYDDQGRAYLCTLTFDHLGSQSYWAHGAGPNGIFVRRSADGGRTWDMQAVAVKVWRGGEPDIQWEDMPRIFADTSPKSPHAGSLYVGWIEWQLEQSIMLFARSTDQGRTWSKPMRISTHAGLPRDDNGGLVGFTGAVAPDGTIYATWNDLDSIALAVSHDGGRTFEPSRIVLHVGPTYFGGAGGIPGAGRVMGFPQVAVDASTGGAGGRLYITWSDFTNGDVDVFIAASDDHGKTWSAPLRVNDDPKHDGIDQFFQWLAVDPVTGAVNVQFYDRRADPANRRTGMTLARSTDGGRTFTSYRWSDDTFGAAPFLGDYTWLTAYGGKVYGVWTEAEPAPPSEAAAAAGPPRAGTIVRVGTADFAKR